VNIEGHCDERGTREYNLALGERRSEAVRRYLISAGVRSTQIETVSFGEERPVDPGHDESAWAKNRRAEMSYRQ
ncbi:MAG: OmpA family protein, partial [Gammaproteobacteria bacterium]|nr:OmpA family protein [Gammaproteobacteria bacterium]